MTRPNISFAPSDIRTVLDLSTSARLMALFDAAGELECEVSLFEHRIPGSWQTLETWARSRNLRVEVRRVELRGDRAEILKVGDGRRSIEVMRELPRAVSR